jgi:DNA-binding IclR family transcriptional regulator
MPKNGEPRSKRVVSAKNRAGVQSVVIAAKVLKALAAKGGIAPLKELAAATTMPRAKVHRYLGSLRVAGLVGQDPHNGHYQIASAAVTIGLVGLHRMSPVRQLQDMLPRLRDRINETVTGSIWTDRGPMIVAIEESAQVVTMNVRIGSVLPVSNTSIGRLFLAYMPPAHTARLVATERGGSMSSDVSPENDLQALLASIRTRHLSQTHSALIPGLDAIAAPVFDHREQIVAVICVVGHSAAKITKWDGEAARELRLTAAELSAQLGSLTELSRERIALDRDTAKSSNKQVTDARAPQRGRTSSIYSERR